MTYPVRKTPFFKRPLFIVSVLVLAGAITVAALELTNTTHFLHATKTAQPLPMTAGQASKGEPATSNSTANGSSTPSSGSSNTTQPGDNKEGTATTTTLLDPLGNFVSAHKNVPLTAVLSSTCTTSAGAECKIVFTSNGTTKSLPAQTTDRAGATYWNSWTPNSIGLTPGTWTVQAVATLNGQSKTATDATALEIVQ